MLAKKKISGTYPASYVIHCDKHDMNANEGTDAGPRCTSAGEPSTNQHPKSRWFFAAKDERRES